MIIEERENNDSACGIIVLKDEYIIVKFWRFGLVYIKKSTNTYVVNKCDKTVTLNISKKSSNLMIKRAISEIKNYYKLT